MITQFLVSLIATLAFAYLFAAPKSDLVYCGITGAVGWIIYVLCTDFGTGIGFANIMASFALTLTARIFSAVRKRPATVYLRPGIFPLVPGAGIYYTSYYLIANDIAKAGGYGLQTLIVAGSITLGILFGSALPQTWFNALSRKFPRKH